MDFIHHPPPPTKRQISNELSKQTPGDFAVTSGILHHLAASSKDNLASHNIYSSEQYKWQSSEAVILTRVSSQKQADEGYSLDWQGQDSRNCLSYKGVGSPTIINEGANDARNVKRKTLLEAVRIAKEKQCPIVVWALDRLFRADARKLTESLATLKSYGVDFVYFKPLDVPNPTRQKNSFAVKRELGELCGRPFYDNSAALTVILNHLGESLRDIAKALNNAGVAPQSGKTWGPQAVKNYFARYHFDYIDSLKTPIDWSLAKKVGPTLEPRRVHIEGPSRLFLSDSFHASQIDCNLHSENK
jgi:hypothetical protein